MLRWQTAKLIKQLLHQRQRLIDATSWGVRCPVVAAVIRCLETVRLLSSKPALAESRVGQEAFEDTCDLLLASSCRIGYFRVFFEALGPRWEQRPTNRTHASV